MPDDRLYNLLALFDTREDTLIANLVRAACEGYERSAPEMGEHENRDAWDEFDALWRNSTSEERLKAARELEDDLRLFLTTALRMLADQPPYSYRTIGTPWWDGAVAIARADEAKLGGDVAVVREVMATLDNDSSVKAREA